MQTASHARLKIASRTDALKTLWYGVVHDVIQILVHNGSDPHAMWVAFLFSSQHVVSLAETAD